MRKWALPVLILLLVLAACSDDNTAPDTIQPTSTVPDAEATEEVLADGYELDPRTPGLKVRDGLTLLSTNEGAVDGTAYFFAEVRNDSGHYLSQVDAVIYSLDQNGLQIDEFSMGTLLTDIRPDRLFSSGVLTPSLMTPSTRNTGSGTRPPTSRASRASSTCPQRSNRKARLKGPPMRSTARWRTQAKTTCSSPSLTWRCLARTTPLSP